MGARIIGPEVVAKGIASNGALGEIRHAVVILLVLHVYPMPVDRLGAAKQRVVNVHQNAIPFTHLTEHNQLTLGKKYQPGKGL